MMKGAALVTLLALASPLWAAGLGGSDAVPHAHPYQVGLKITPRGWREQFCSGALISNEWIVVAAHCLQDVKSIIAVLGAHNIEQRETTARTLPVVQIVVHPDHSPYSNDIGLVKLADGLILDSNIAPICLPPRSRKNVSFVGWPVVITGWGKGGYSGNYLVPTLQAIHTKVADDTVCQEQYATGRYNMTNNICASGYKGNPQNIGRSGDPMVIEENGGQYLLGIGSFNSDWGVDRPTAYTRMTTYLDWIQEVTGISAA